MLYYRQPDTKEAIIATRLTTLMYALTALLLVDPDAIIRENDDANRMIAHTVLPTLTPKQDALLTAAGWDVIRVDGTIHRLILYL